MRMRTARLALTAMLVILSAGTSRAHHSFAAFDRFAGVGVLG
jgi:hypothetical protein